MNHPRHAACALSGDGEKTKSEWRMTKEIPSSNYEMAPSGLQIIGFRHCFSLRHFPSLPLTRGITKTGHLA
jgi:hypothetical protein